MIKLTEIGKANKKLFYSKLKKLGVYKEFIEEAKRQDISKGKEFANFAKNRFNKYLNMSYKVVHARFVWSDSINGYKYWNSIGDKIYYDEV